MTTTTPEAEVLRREIEAQRANLGYDLEALGDHMSPGRMVERRKAAAGRRLHRMRDRVMGTADDVSAAVGDRAESAAHTIGEAPDMAREHMQGTPLAMGLATFGLGIVAASVLPPTQRERELVRQAEPTVRRAAEEAGSIARDEAEQLKPIAEGAAQDLREDAMDAGRVVQEQAQAGMSDVQDQARTATSEVADQARG